MDRIAEIVAQMRSNPADIRFSEAKRVCDHYFGPPRQAGTSHCVYRMPWQGDPRVNIQRGSGGKAKPYQIRQIIRAIERLEAENVP